MLSCGSPDVVVFIGSPEEGGTVEQTAVGRLMQDAHDPAGWFVDRVLGVPIPIQRAFVIVGCSATSGMDPFFCRSGTRILLRAYPAHAKGQMLQQVLFPEALERRGLPADWAHLDDALVSRVVREAAADSGLVCVQACAESLADAPCKQGATLGIRDLHTVIPLDDVVEDMIQPYGRSSSELGVCWTVSAVQGLPGSIDSLEVAAVRRGLRGRRITTTALVDSADESVDVALTAVAVLIESGLAQQWIGEVSPSVERQRAVHDPAPYAGARAVDSSSGVRVRSPMRRPWEPTDGSGSSDVPAGRPIQRPSLSLSDNHSLEEPLLNFLHSHEFHVLFAEPSMRPSAGSSAGLAIALSILSRVLQRPIPADMAVTGSITPTGRVMQVGNLHDKVAALVRHGIHRLLMPASCQIEFEALPEHLRTQVAPLYTHNLAQACERLWSV